MIKNGLKSVATMFRYAPIQTVLVLLMMVVVSVFTILTVHINKNLVDSVGVFVTEKNNLLTLCLWGLLLFLSIMFGMNEENYPRICRN